MKEVAWGLGLDGQDGCAAILSHPATRLDEHPSPPELTDGRLFLGLFGHSQARGRKQDRLASLQDASISLEYFVK